MKRLRWMRSGTGPFISQAYDTSMRKIDGRYEIEKVWAPNSKGFGWYVTGPDWDGGYRETLTEAKADAEKHYADVLWEALSTTW